jgi:hypothetical protein
MSSISPSDDLAIIFDQIITMLNEGATHQKASFNHLSFASLARDGTTPQCRTVILRHVEVSPLILSIHSDFRREKIREIRQNPAISLLFYCSTTEQQLRLEAHADIYHNCPMALTQWQQATPYNKRIYLATSPGALTSHAISSLVEETQTTIPDHDNTAAGYKNFCLIKLKIKTIDWLQLSKDGNRQAIFTPKGHAQWQGQWIYP